MTGADPATPTDPAELLDGLLERLAGVLAGTSSGVPSEGTDAEQLVTARLGADGRVAQLEADPRVLRDRTRLGPAIVEAVNAAVAARSATSDRSGTIADLRTLQDESMTVSQQFNASLLASLDGLKGQR